LRKNSRCEGKGMLIEGWQGHQNALKGVM